MRPDRDWAQDRGRWHRYSAIVTSPVLQTFPLGTQWPTIDPFLFVAHHLDAYPRGDEQLGPKASLGGRAIGQDFSGRDGWNMYHGSVVPGFPQHPHRGFETVTHVRTGIIDHSDSLGATARFGHGDTQWLTTGAGVQHAEMFPLVDPDHENPLELFQIWLNLPAADKMVDPYFTMLWNHRTPRHRAADDAGRTTEITVIAGTLAGLEPAAPPPDSWAAKAESDVAIWHIHIQADGEWALPRARGSETQRMLYAFDGSSIRVGDDDTLQAGNGAAIRTDVDIDLVAGPEGVQCMLLQGRPIDESVAQYGPFVMNTNDELRQAMADYQSTRFGGWPWPDPAPDHGPTQGRFALHADGRREEIG